MLKCGLLGSRSTMKKVTINNRAICSTIINRKTLNICNQKKHFATKINGSAKRDDKVVAYYCAALAVTILGVAYASVPLYKVFCSMTGKRDSIPSRFSLDVFYPFPYHYYNYNLFLIGFGGTTQRADDKKAALIKPVAGGKVIKVHFTSNVHSTMCWKFNPTQREVKIIPGETALAFYTVSNPSDKAITGVASYNVFPPKAGIYFSKIQCFCFEEQRLGAKEEIDMPVFFYIDPEFANDPAMDSVNTITLSYTFFKTGEEDEEPVEDAITNKVPLTA